MEYTIKIQELVNRPIVRNDKHFEFLNKMTDDEIELYESELYQIIKNDMIIDKNVEYNILYLSKIFDRDILYNLFKLQ